MEISPREYLAGNGKNNWDQSVTCEVAKLSKKFFEGTLCMLETRRAIPPKHRQLHRQLFFSAREMQTERCKLAELRREREKRERESLVWAASVETNHLDPKERE